MTYDEAKKLILHALDPNPAAHPDLELALDILLREVDPELPPDPFENNPGAALRSLEEGEPDAEADTQEGD